MANYKTVGAKSGTTLTSIYTNSGTTPAYIMLARVTNNLAATSIVTVKFYDSSAGVAYNIVLNLNVPVGASIRIFEDRLVLEPGDSIQVSSTAANACDVVLSVMEG